MLPSFSSVSQIMLLLIVLFFKSNLPVDGKVCDSNNGASLATNPLVWRNQPQIHVVNWVDDNLCANRQECYGTPAAGSQESDRQEHYPQLCPIYIQFGDPVYFVSGPGERDYLNPIAVSQKDFQNCSLITYPYYWKVTTFPKRHTLKVPPRFLFPGDHHFFQIPFLGTPDCQTGYRVKVTVRSQDCTVPSYPSQPCFGNGYCIYTGNNFGNSEIPAPGSAVTIDPNCTLPEGKNYPHDLQIFTCKCRIPFKGRYCEDYDACWNHACQNGGLCNDLRRGINNKEYTCTCPTNYIGKHCEYVKACFEGLCQNNGQCFYDTSRPAHFQCLCAPGYTGERCDTPMGPRQDFINNLTDTLIAEQRERDDTLKALDSMGANTTALSYPRIIIAPFVTQARQSGGIGSGNYTLPAVCSNKPREGSGPDCAECGCSHSGLCIRESSGGPNTCFCPPGVSGPECRTLAGLCTYTQPCQNGGTCLERMIGNRAGIGGGSNAIAEEDDDTDSLMFPAPGETPPPPLTMSMAAINAQPPMGADDLNSRQQGGPPRSKDKLAYICVCPKGWFGYNCESRVKDGKVCSPNDCCIDGDKPMDGANLDVICARRQQGAGTPSPVDDGRSYTQPPWSDKVDYGRDKVEEERERGDQSPSQPPVIPIIEMTSPSTPKVKDEARDKIVDDAKRRQDEERRRMESSCQNGGTPVDSPPPNYDPSKQIFCTCPPSFAGPYCETYMSPEMLEKLKAKTATPTPSVTILPIYTGPTLSRKEEITTIVESYPPSEFGYPTSGPMDSRVVTYETPPSQSPPYIAVIQPATFPAQPTPTEGRGPEFDQMFCQNGGTPLRDPDRSPQAGPVSATSRQNVFCICPQGFKGDMCETTTSGAPTAHSMEICVDNQICQNGGHCQKKTLPNGAAENKCLCPIPYGGKLCENGSLGLTEPMFSDSYIKYSQPIAWDNGGKLVFQVQMVPKSDTGTIFNIINGGNDPPNSNISFHLYLKDGMINYDVTQVGTGANLAHVTANASDLIGQKSTVLIENHFQPGTTRLGAVTMLVMKGNDKIYEVKTVNNNTLPPSNVDIRFGPQTDILVGAPSEQNVANDGTATGAAQQDGSLGSTNNFKGSILSLRINGKKIDLINDAKNGLNVINSNPGTCENVCRNGGQCVTEGWKWRCQCPDGFQGTFCERRFCNNCQNGGMCIDLRGNGQYICLCPYGWTGLNCQESLNIVVKQAFQFNGLKFGYSSYALFYPLSGLEYDFEIRFKFIVDSENSTSWTSSLLMYAGQGVTEGKFNPYFVIGIQKGYIVFRYDLDDQDPSTSQGMRELITSVPLDKSLPSHEIRFGRKYNESWLYVDNLPEVLDKASYNNNYRLDIWSGLFVGGFNTYLMQLLPKGASIFRSGFKGCIYDIYIRRDQEPDHKSILESGAQLKQSLNVLPCFRQPFCGKDSCQNNGICVDLGANYHCRCGPNYSGPKCEIPTGSQEPTTISNAIQPGGNVYIPGQAETTTSYPATIAQEIVDEFSKNQCELIIDNSLNEAFSVNIKFAGNPNTEQIIIILNIMAENKSLYKLTFVLDFRPLINIRQGESVAIKDDVFILPLNNSVSIRNFTLSKIKSKLSINVNDVVHDLQVNITNHEIIHSLSLGLGNLNKNITNLALINTNRNFCYKTAELIIQNSVINIEDYFNCNMIEKCKD